MASSSQFTNPQWVRRIAIYRKRLAKAKKAILVWRPKYSKIFVEELQDCFHQLVLYIIGHLYVLQNKKQGINRVTNQVTTGTSDDIYFGMDASFTNGYNMVLRFAYASKSGKGTIGIDPENRFIHPFNSHIRKVIYDTTTIARLFEIIGPEESLGINAVSVKIYFDENPESDCVKGPKKTPMHCDFIYNKDNTPRKNANSQKENTHVFIWTIGHNKTLTFEKSGEQKRSTYVEGSDRKYNSEYKDQPFKDTRIDFDLGHMSLFHLHPDQEKWTDMDLNTLPTKGRTDWRPLVEKGKKVRWKHGAKKTKEGGFSISIMLRCVTAKLPVYAHSGRVICTDDDKR